MCRTARFVQIAFGCSVILALVLAGCHKPERSEETMAPVAQPSPTSRGAAPAGVLTLVYSSDELGDIRSAGCPKADLGGLGRREAFVRKTRDETPHMLLLHAGGLFGERGPQGELKAQVAIDSLAEMRYDAVTIGDRELNYGRSFLSRAMSRGDVPYMSTNVVDADSHEPFAPSPHLVKKMPWVCDVVILGVTSQRFQKQLAAHGLKLLPVEETVRRYIKGIEKDGTFVVVLAYTDRDEASRLARQVAGIDLIVVGDIRRVGQPKQQAWREGQTLLVQGQPKGRAVGRIDITLDRQAKVITTKNVSIPMANTWAEPDQFARRFRQYEAAVKALPRKAIANGERRYATSRHCLTCHEQAAEAWQNSRHARAFDAVVKRGQQYDPECIGCHVLGYGKEGGFVSIDQTPELANVQCENCHGTGLDHVADTQPSYGGRASASCVRCHVEDFSPNFQYGPYWAKIAHR